MKVTSESDAFLDVDRLLHNSEPPPRRASSLWFGVGIIVLVSMLLTYFGSTSAGGQRAVDLLSPIITLGLATAFILYLRFVARRYQREIISLEAIGELVQLRRWSQAAGAIERFLLARPRNATARAQAMVLLGGVLARYHRFDDAVLVFDHLLENVSMDDETIHGIGLGRAMALLREDRLVDADRAISTLRRTAERNSSAGLILVEMYRSVKTGHPDDAANAFEQHLSLLRDKLGIRVADVYGLAARAYDLLYENEKAAATWLQATTLAPAGELVRRYPELQKTANQHPAARWPDMSTTL